MYVEKRKAGSKTRFYLAHPYRDGKRVRKLRVYLGVDLSEKELAEKRKPAEEKLAYRLKARKAVRDPFATAISPTELKELKNLEGRGKLVVSHLSDSDWLRFTEAFTYDTNAIEGSTLSSSEVGQILEKDKWPRKPKEDISEAYGVARAVEFIRKTGEHLSVPLILELHRLVFQNSKPFAGRLRKRGVEVVIADASGGIIHRGAPSTQVRQLLNRLVDWYRENNHKYPPLVLAAVVHNQFENIHPFQDGNGRVGRLLMNNILLKHGLPPLTIELRNRRQYYLALRAYERDHDLRPTIDLMLKEYRALKNLLRRG